MEIKRTIKGQEYTFTLTIDELYKAFKEQEHSFLSDDVELQLESMGTVKGMSAELFKNQRFYDTVIKNVLDMETTNENIWYAIENTISWMTDQECMEYIQPKLIEFCEQMDDRIYISNDRLHWCYYNPDASSGGQIVYMSYDLEKAKEALTNKDPIYEIQTNAHTELIDINTLMFSTAAIELQNHKPTFTANEENILSELTKYINERNEETMENYHEYTIRRLKDPWGSNIYFGYKDNKQYTDAEDTISDLFEHNQEFAQFNVITDSAQKGYIDTNDFTEANMLIMSDEDKQQHIYGFEIDQGNFHNIRNDPELYKKYQLDKALYEKLIQERSELSRQPSEEIITILKEAGYWNKANGVAVVAEYKNGELSAPYFYENFENDIGLDRAVKQFDEQLDNSISGYTVVSDGKVVPLEQINEVRMKLQRTNNTPAEEFKWIPGTEISRKTYEDMYNSLPPISLNNVVGFQSSEPYSCEFDKNEGRNRTTYMTFVKSGNRYFYAGNNFAHEVRQEQLDEIKKTYLSEKYVLQRITDAYDGHKRDTYTESYSSLSVALEEYKASRDCNHIDIVTLCDNNRKMIMNFENGNETIYLKNVPQEQQNMVLSSSRNQTVDIPQKIKGRR